jgi:Xaa-Pro aminopeptidase
MGKAGHQLQLRKMVEQIKGDLKANGVLKEPVGIDVYDPMLVEAFKKEGLEITPAGAEALIEARAIKTKDEIECLRIAAAISDAIFYALKEAIKPGVSEYELLAKMFETAYKHGAEVYAGMFVTSGRYTWPNLRHFVGRIIRPGDIVYADTYNMGWNGYRTCYYRTFSCGQPPQSIKDTYKRAYDWLYSAIKAIKPGGTTKEVAEKFPEASKVWGWYGVTSEDQNAGSNWAHGIGLSLYEPPVIWRATSIECPEKILPGMTFAIETQDGDPVTRQGVRMEEMLVVTESGVELLSKWPIEEITVCPI